MITRGFRFKYGSSSDNIYELSPNDNLSGVFLSNPQGLGFSFKTDWEENADSFFFSTTSKGEQGSVSGDLLFLGGTPPESYKLYEEFVNYIFEASNSGEDLKFGYWRDKYENSVSRAITGDWYYANCFINKLEKSEIGHDTGILTCGVEITLLSPWAIETPLSYDISVTKVADIYYSKSDGSDPDEGVAKTYAKRDDGTSSYIYGKERGARNFTVTGHIPGAYELVMSGSGSSDTDDNVLKNPTILFYKYDTTSWKTIGGIVLRGNSDDSPVTIKSGEFLEISTRPDNTYIRRKKISGANVVTYDDLSNYVSLADYDGNGILDPFTRLPIGKCRIDIKNSFTDDNTTSVTVYNYYRSV